MASLELLNGQPFEIGWGSQVIALDDGIGALRADDLQRGAAPSGARRGVGRGGESSRARAKLLKDWLKRTYNIAPDATQMALATTDQRETLNAITGRTVPNHDMSGDADRAFLRGMIVADRYALALAQIAALQTSAKAELPPKNSRRLLRNASNAGQSCSSPCGKPAFKSVAFGSS